MYLLFTSVFLCLFSCSSAWGRGDWEKFGPFQMILNSKFIKCDRNKSLNLDVSRTFVYFYDYSKEVFESYAINDAAKGILSIKELDKGRKFIVYVGGYTSHINKHTEERIRDTFRDLPDTYLIILDHSPYTNDKLGYKKSYERSVRYVHSIGQAIGEMLADLSKGGISPKKMHCIGHSLGSQILGSAGETFTNLTGKKLWRITALDPAGPCFAKSLIEEQIRSGLAEYVEVYHCNSGGLGTTSILGDVDFLINKKGQSQPNCGTPYLPGIFDSTKAARCNHRTCLQIYTTTVKHPGWFPAWKCDSYKIFKSGHCPNEHRTTAGYWNPGNATGVYYFTTKGYLLD